jgi:hypothetical protein
MGYQRSMSSVSTIPSAVKLQHILLSSRSVFFRSYAPSYGSRVKDKDNAAPCKKR